MKLVQFSFVLDYAATEGRSLLEQILYKQKTDFPERFIWWTFCILQYEFDFIDSLSCSVLCFISVMSSSCIIATFVRISIS